ncbi:MAG TPA: hypothetical protein VGG99_07255 [Acetobacteraceae bacterium]|jgi:hypothetical protein
MALGFELFREQAAGEYNRLSHMLPGSRRYVIARARQIIRQLDHFATTPDLTEAEQFWLEVIKEAFEELVKRAGGNP